MLCIWGICLNPMTMVPLLAILADWARRACAAKRGARLVPDADADTTSKVEGKKEA